MVLLANLGWLLGLAVLWRSGRSVDSVETPEDAGRAADVFGVAAVVFGGLYLLMSRFSIYAFPFVTLWALFELKRRGRLPGRSMALLGGRRIPVAVALGLALLASLPGTLRELGTFAPHRSGTGRDPSAGA